MIKVVLLHGFCENKSMWDSTIQALDDAWNIWAFDLSGFGSNQNPATSMFEYAKDVFAQMDRENIDRAVILGHSMGGYVALEMMAQDPDRIVGLGLVHSNAAADDEERIAIRKKQIAFLDKHDTKPYLKPFSEQLLGQSNRDNKELTSQTWELVKDTQAPAIINALNAMMGRTDYRELIRRTEKPVLWLLGEEDDFINLDQVLPQVGNTNKAQLAVLKEVGHLGTWESPTQTQKVVDSFLSWVLS